MKISITIKLSILFGIISCIAWYMFAKNLGFYSDKVYWYKNYFVFGVLLIGIPLSVFLEKRNNNGFIEFKEALKKGMVYSLVLAVIIGIFNYLYHTFITPDTIAFFLSEAKKAAITHGVKASDIPRILEGEREAFGSFRLIPPIFFWGLIVSLLSGAILQKSNSNRILDDQILDNI